MSLRLPLSTSPLRECFDVQSLVEWRTLPSFRQALNGCRNTIAADSSINSANALAIRADGEIWMIRVGKKGGWKKLWNFGNPLQHA